MPTAQRIEALPNNTPPAVKHLRQRVAAALRWQAAWDSGTPWLIAGAGTAAASVLILRQAILPYTSSFTGITLITWAAALVAGIIPLLVAARRQPSELRIAQAQESWGRGDGFLASAATNTTDQWHHHQQHAAAAVTIPALSIPRRRWLLLAGLAATACWLVPTRPAPPINNIAPQPLAALFEPAQQRLDDLVELGLLTEPEVEEFDQRLQPLLEDADDGRLEPGAWQAFERWQAAAEQQAAERQAALNEAAAALNNQEHAGTALAEALRAVSQDPELFKELSQQLSDALHQTNQANLANKAGQGEQRRSPAINS